MANFDRRSAGKFIILLACGIYGCSAVPLTQLKGSESPRPLRKNALVVVAYDVGEILAMLPTVRKLSENGISVTWVPLTPWSRDLLINEEQQHQPLPDDLDQMLDLNDRSMTFSIQPWTTVIAEINPSMVVVGMASSAQLGIAKVSRRQGSTTIGYYDAFDPPSDGGIALAFIGELDELWVPSRDVKKRFLEKGFQKVWIAGQPSVEAWRLQELEIDGPSIRSAIGLSEDDRVILFAGQYGEGYEEVFRAFVQQSTSLAGMGIQDARVVVSPHPRTEGILEREIIHESPDNAIILAPAGLSTRELGSISSVVVTWTSTVGVQAAFCGKPVIYFSAEPDNKYDNFLVRSGLAISATPETFPSTLWSAMNTESVTITSEETLQSIGYILEADARITARIQRLMSE